MYYNCWLGGFQFCGHYMERYVLQYSVDPIPEHISPFHPFRELPIQYETRQNSAKQCFGQVALFFKMIPILRSLPFFLICSFIGVEY